MLKMATRPGMLLAGLGMALTLSLSACHDHDHEHHADPQMDRLLQQQAREMEELAAQVKLHIAGFRALSPDVAQQRMNEHARVVIQLSSQMSRHMRELASAKSAGVDHDHTGHDHAAHDHAAHDHAAHDHEAHDHAAHDHAGHDQAGHAHEATEGDLHGEMMTELQRLRVELDELQAAAQPALAERLPAHLDRLDRYADLLIAQAGYVRQR